MRGIYVGNNKSVITDKFVEISSEYLELVSQELTEIITLRKFC